MSVYEIPLIPGPQRITIRLGSQYYSLSLSWCTPISTWMISIMNDRGVWVLSNIPMVTDYDLLEPYEYLGIGGHLFAKNLGTQGDPIDYSSLGRTGKLYFLDDK